MLEPLAASILNSVVSSSRPSFSAHIVSSSQPALRMATSRVLSHDFFTPHPRQCKGKERALPEPIDCMDVDRDSARGRGGYGSQNNYGRHRVPTSRDGIPCRQRIRRSTCQGLHGEPPRSRMALLSHSWMPSKDGTQRRHVSSQSDPSSSSDTPGTSGPGPLETAELIKGYVKGVSDVEKAWNTYRHFKSHGQQDLLDTETLLAFAKQLLDAIRRSEHPSTAIPPDDAWKLGGIRVKSLLLDIEPRLDYTRERFWWLIYLTQAEAYANDIDDAIQHARQASAFADYGNRREGQVNMYTSILESVERYMHPAAIVELVAEEWDTFGPYYRRAPLRALSAIPNNVAPKLHTLRAHASRLVSRIRDPVGVLRNMQNMPERYRMNAARFMIEGLCEHKMADVALSVLEELEGQDVWPPNDLVLTVVNGLVTMGRFERATKLFMSIAGENDVLPMEYSVQVTGLRLFAHWGKHTIAEQYFKRIQEANWLGAAEVATLMHCYAVRGEPTRVVKIFERFFPVYAAEQPRDSSKSSPPPVSSEDQTAALEYTSDTTPTPAPPTPMYPNVVHYSSIIRAYMKVGNRPKITRWLTRMRNTGIPPDSQILHIVLDYFLKVQDIASVSSILKQMREANIWPQPHTYTSVISLFAERRDSEAAEDLLKQAVKEGVIPDRHMLSAVMFAHVEAGNWPGVIRMYDYMRLSMSRGIRMTIEVFNNLIKAYVLTGAPYEFVRDIYYRLIELKIDPDDRTYALVIQSACDAGKMDTAERFFRKLQALANTFPSDLTVNVYVLTIIMAGYLRLKNKVGAKKVFDRMRELDIKPTSVTYAIILRAYSKENPNVEDSVGMAENFLGELLEEEKTLGEDEKSWTHVKGGRAAALVDVYGPVMKAYAERAQFEEVERLYNSMLQNGGRPMLGGLTALMDAYRRTRQFPDKVREVWQQIYELAQQQTSETDALFVTSPRPKHGRGSVLCIPLSIYTDAMSLAGDHMAVSDAWTQLQDDGYSFDAHNWNHLVIALLRAGEVERAFSVVERVLLVHEHRSRYAIPVRELRPGTPFSSDVNPRHFVAQGEGAAHNPDRRAERAMYYATKVNRKWMKPPIGTKIADFPHPLHILAQISPNWNIWRPHGMVLTYLGRVMQHLMKGGRVQPITPGYKGMKLVQPQNVTNPAQARKSLEEAAAQLQKLYSDYPETVRAVQGYFSWRGDINERMRSQVFGDPKTGPSYWKRNYK